MTLKMKLLTFAEVLRFFAAFGTILKTNRLTFAAVGMTLKMKLVTFAGVLRFFAALGTNFKMVRPTLRWSG
jgi:hypothetical protein